MNRRTLTSIFEITGSTSHYALLIASNTDNEVRFSLLLVSAILFAAWAVIDKRWTAVASLLRHVSDHRPRPLGLERLFMRR